MRKINKQLHSLLSWLSITVFVLLTLDVILGVSSRYLFGGQVRWTEELATFLLVWLVFCGAAVAYHDNAHLGIDLLVQSLEPGASRIAQILSLLIVLLFVFGVMVIGGSLLVAERLDSGQMMPTLGISKAWLYLSVPINGWFITFFNLEMIWNTLTAEGWKRKMEVSS